MSQTRLPLTLEIRRVDFGNGDFTYRLVVGSPEHGETILATNLTTPQPNPSANVALHKVAKAIGKLL